MSGTDGFDPERISYVSSFGDITARHPEPMLRATGKVLPALDRHCRAMIERSTFCVISSFGPNGADVSPRGDPPGFCRILDDRHLLLPDRIGNNRFDTMGNLFHNPAVGMLFLVPGDPTSDLKAIKTISMVVKDGTMYFPSEIYPKFGIEPFVDAPKVVAAAAK